MSKSSGETYSFGRREIFVKSTKVDSGSAIHSFGRCEENN
jgi:hypothetical protein